MDGRFAFEIPEGLPSKFAAPLLCGGITVFTPFVHHQISPLHKVGVIGIGGPGHLAIQFGRAFGAEVTAFSSTNEKEAKELGADHFIHTKGSNWVEGYQNSFDFLLHSSSSGIDLTPFMSLLRPKGKLCFLGGLEHKIDLPIGSLVDGRKTLCGSNIGSRWMIEKMLEVANRQRVLPLIEEFSFEKVNEAIEKLQAGKVCYRAVLKR